MTGRFAGGPACRAERVRLRRSLGLAEHRLRRPADGRRRGQRRPGPPGRRDPAAVPRRRTWSWSAGATVRLKRRLDRLRGAVRRPADGDRLRRQHGDWLRCCDLVVTKAGPGTIAEAACCGTPLLLTAHSRARRRAIREIVTGAGPGSGCRTCGGSWPRSAGCAGTTTPSRRCAPRLRAWAGLTPRGRTAEADRRPDPGQRPQQCERSSCARL